MRQQPEHPVSCHQFPSSPMASDIPAHHHWLPQHDPEPATEVLSGDLYLLTPASTSRKDCSSSSSKSISNSRGSKNSSNSNNSKSNNGTTSNRRARGSGGGDGGGLTWVRCPVHVHIYRSCFGHYAVISANLRAPATFLNLRSCNARPCHPSSSDSSSSSSSRSSSSFFPATSSDAHLVRRFRVELGGGEGQVIYFEVSPPSSALSGGRDSVEEWVRAFQGSGVPSPGNISPSLSPVIPRNPIMPTLQESIEEEEEDEEGGEEEVNEEREGVIGELR